MRIATPAITIARHALWKKEPSPDLAEEALCASSAIRDAQDKLRAMARLLDPFPGAPDDHASFVRHPIEPFIDAAPAQLSPNEEVQGIALDPSPAVDHLVNALHDGDGTVADAQLALSEGQ